MDAVAKIKKMQELINEINISLEELMEELRDRNEAGPAVRRYETFYPLSANPAIFKGRTPTCVMFGKERVIAQTWKNVFKQVIQRCNSIPDMHKRLMELRNKVLGRDRVLLSDTPENMRRPYQIDKKMYAETHYDTETLMRILLHRFLDEVDFDYSGISVGIKN